MTLDLTRAIGAISRKLTIVDHEGRPAESIVASRHYDTPIDDLWDAMTHPERLPRWFLPVEGDLRVGGRFQLKGNAGGEILECEPPARLALTWEAGGNTSWVRVDLETQDGGTLLTLEQLAHTPPEFWEQYGPGATGVGWDLTLFGLDEYFRDEPVVVPETAEAWALSEEGKNFSRQSSEAWGAASIAAGTDPEAARAATDNTTKFYTGEG
ncbi:MAG: SRPBCC family protein [Acidobacteriota bacterium]